MASFSNWMQQEQERMRQATQPTATTTPLEDIPIAEEVANFTDNELELDSALELLEQELMGEMRSRDFRNEQERMMTTPAFTEYALPVVKSWEAFEPEAYLPTEDDVLTIGYGQTEGVREGDTITEEEASAYLAEQLAMTGSRLEEELGEQWEMLSPAQQAAVASLAYNVDKDVVGQFKKSKAFKALKSGDVDEFIYQAFDPKQGFVKQNKKTLKGLQRRREAEKNLFLYGDDFDVASLDSSVLNV